METMISREVVDIAREIKEMKIRGAGRIARAAAKALKIAAENYRGKTIEGYLRYINAVARLLISTRPTAVSLLNAVTYILSRIERVESTSLADYISVTVAVAEEFIEYSENAVKNIALIGSGRISDGDSILTHCNSSAALSVIIEAWRSGKKIQVYATETRPKYQGHITIKQLAEAGVKVTLIPDSAVRLLMKKLDKVIVGADTVAANGAVVNKIGTSQLALAAKEANVDFFVAAETYKFSPATVLGELVEIEERPAAEVIDLEFLRAHPNINVRNPAFDVTPPEYIDAIITERGLIPPQAAYLVLVKEYGWAITDHYLKATSEISDEILP